jgi:hypothetical protein
MNEIEDYRLISVTNSTTIKVVMTVLKMTYKHCEYDEINYFHSSLKKDLIY